MSKIYHIIIFVLLLFLFLSCSPTQQLGKIYTKDNAKQLLGNVVYSTEIERDTVAGLLNKTEKNIMFGIINKNLIILDNNRKLLYPLKAEFNDNDVFTVYSISVVKDLLSKGSSPIINVEQRREVLSVSYDNNTMEYGTKCPPICDSE
jgi:hypothetical protein